MKRILLIFILINLSLLTYGKEENLELDEEEYIFQEEEEPVTGKSIFFTNSDQIKIEIKDHTNDFKYLNQNISDLKNETNEERVTDEKEDKIEISESE